MGYQEQDICTRVTLYKEELNYNISTVVIVDMFPKCVSESVSALSLPRFN